MHRKVNETLILQSKAEVELYSRIYPVDQWEEGSLSLISFPVQKAQLHYKPIEGSLYVIVNLIEVAREHSHDSG